MMAYRDDPKLIKDILGRLMRLSPDEQVEAMRTIASTGVLGELPPLPEDARLELEAFMRTKMN